MKMELKKLKMMLKDYCRLVGNGRHWNGKLKRANIVIKKDGNMPLVCILFVLFCLFILIEVQFAK